MAIYHLSVKTISRSAGRSATAAAAYRAGVEIADERTGEIHDYTRKGGIESAELILPANAPEWAADRAALWNAAEQAETRKNSTVAREFEIALPAELSPAERQRLAHDFAREIVGRHGGAADVAIHAPGKEGDNRNHHAHILLSTRRLGPEGFTEKTRELDDQKTGPQIVTQWRERFASLQNERLRENGIEARVDHRTLEAQGINREPTRHLGPAAAGFERRTGEPSRKRQDWQQEAADRLARAREAGELEHQGKEIDRAILDLSGDLAAAKREREKAERRAAEQEQRQRIERMTAAELAQEIARLRPPSVDSLVEADPDVIEATKTVRKLSELCQQAQDRETQAQREATQWRKEHGTRAALHDRGIARSSFLDARERTAADARREWHGLAPRIEDEMLTGRHARWAARDRIGLEQAPIRALLAELEQQRQEKARQEREAELERQKQAQNERERALLPEKFKAMARKRELGMSGYTDRSTNWLATPEPLRKLIDSYNRESKPVRKAILDRIRDNPEVRSQVSDMMKEREQSRDRGLSR